VTKNQITKTGLQVVLVCNLKLEEPACLLPFSNYKAKKPVKACFGQLFIWFLVTFDEMKQAQITTKCF
jgi:hypothetical protein